MNYLNGQLITKENLLEFRNHLKENHAAQTVNGTISAINKYLDLNGLPDLKLKLLKVQRSVFLAQEKELTQAEYDRLVATAKRQAWKPPKCSHTTCGISLPDVITSSHMT